MGAFLFNWCLCLLFLLLVRLIHGLFKTMYRLAQRTAQFGQFAGPEDDEYDNQDHDEVQGLKKSLKYDCLLKCCCYSSLSIFSGSVPLAVQTASQVLTCKIGTDKHGEGYEVPA
jgi:hypothetical protein